MRAVGVVVFAGLIVLAHPALAADAERKIDPTFLHRNTATAREVASDITATGCHYKPLFGEGDAAANPDSGVARFAVVVVDPSASCKSVSYTSEDQIYVVLDGAGAATYGGKQVSLAKEDFLYVPASVAHALRNTSTTPVTVAVMGYRTRGFAQGTLPPHPLKDNIANVPLELVGSHPTSTHYRLLLGDSSQTRDRIDIGSVVTSLFLMEIDPGGTNFPHHHPREEEIYLVLDGRGDQVAGSGADGIAGRFPAGPGDAYYYRANATVGYYSAPNMKSRILCIRSWQPGLQPGSEKK
ncbi:MAG TPA: cupin domain-containing protein [Rhizomicrobium sp.]|nr:cupin domain-containing protein [Rhizomicrobium sp.]